MADSELAATLEAPFPFLKLVSRRRATQIRLA
jgi:hypothetical protein